MFSQDDFSRLATVEAYPAITIYLPTHRAGQETQNGHDRIAFKDAVKDVTRQLEARGQHNLREIDTLLQPLRDLDQDGHFWRNQSDTLAVFLSPQKLDTYSLPIETTATIVQVADSFHLTPAAAMLKPEARYYIFSLALGGNAFYEATRHTITSIFIGDQVPTDLDEVLEPYVGSDSLQSHNTGPRGAGAVFHGQGSNEDRRDEREEIYFTDVSRGLDKLLAGQQEPLLLVCDSQYRKNLAASIKYPHIYPQAVDINPADLTMAQLHTETWKLISSHFEKSSSALQQQFSTAIGAQRFAASLYDVVPAAMSGQVDTLVVAKGQSPVYGSYDDATNAVHFHDTQQEDSRDLVELAIRHTIANGGKVVMRDRSVLPEGVEQAGATLRYTL